ncbi:DUF3084 domain-containing protein [Sporohalobacter salinus]|uniref:DUF3084 domain-containing protein n=1 Tax=Sporohalobacter salinus TaxID=1494606 RepID=UPI00195FC938|nr:DUF3084 domain-containing protein [Sporohalobacter salinus]MBM7622940.1 uncharacterized protein (DUF3084 family) [Sporohalobacter salinus]
MYNNAILIAAVIFISGLIAYIGDQIGMKVGRKRLSLFGLRPRHTSILVTILTGILIATTTITLLLVTSRGVRMALFNMQAMVRELNTLNHKVEVKDNRLQDMKQQIQAKGEELTSLKKQKEKMNKQLKETNSEYEATKEKLKKAEGELKDLTKVKEKLASKVDNLGQEVTSLEKKIKELTDQKKKLEKKVNNLSYSLKFVGQKYLDSMVGDIVYQKGEVVFSEVIQGGQSEQKIVNKLDQFIADANQAALEKGIEEQGSKRVIKMYEEDLFQTAKLLHQQGKRMVVRLVAQKNTLKDEELLAKFKLYEDYQVYQENEVVAKTEIEVTDSLDKLESRIESFLTEINNQAIKDGLIPDTQGKVGSLKFGRFYSLFNKIRQFEKPVVIKIVAVEDIWRSDSLVSNIKFVVQPKER